MEDEGNDIDRSQAKKVTKMFNFDECSFVTHKKPVTVRRSVDCGTARRQEHENNPLNSPKLEFRSSNILPSQRTANKRTTDPPKRFTSKPLLVNFDKLNEISRDLKPQMFGQKRQSVTSRHQITLVLMDDL